MYLSRSLGGNHEMRKYKGVRCHEWGRTILTFVLDQFVNKLGLDSYSRKIKVTAGKRFGQSLFVLLTTAILVACGGGGTADSSDSNGSTNNSTPANQIPVVVDDSAVTSQDTTVVINVLDNDSDPDGDTLQPDTVEVVSQPSNGTATASNGTITYQPTTGFTGPTDSFTYRVQDNRGATSNTATVTVTINRPPTAMDDPGIVTNVNTAVIVDVLDNDGDPDSEPLQPDSVEVVSQPGNGTATAQTNGTITYQPNTGFAGPTDSFTYRVQDNRGATSNTATVTVTINRPPTAMDDPGIVTNVNTAVIVDVLDNDGDPDSDPLQPDTVEVVSQPGNGTATAQTNGTISYQPDSGFTGPTDSFTYRVQDNRGATSNTATVTVTIQNRPPTAMDDPGIVTNENTALIVDVLDNDGDPDGDSLLPDTVEVISQPVNGTATAQSDGTITYQPNNGFTGPTDSFTYTVKDSRGAVSNVATVTVTINRSPVAADDNDITNVDVTVNVNVLSNDSDPESDPLRPDTVVVISQPSNGTATAQSDGTIDYQPNSGFTGPTDSFTYTVQDDQGAISNTATVTVTINQPPVAGGACFATPQESPLTGTDRDGQEVKLAASDSDNTANELTFSLINPSDGLSAGVGPITTDKGEVEITDPTTGAFRYTPNSPPSLRGTDTFDYRVEDTVGGAASGTVTVIIDAKIMPLGDSITEGTEDSVTPDPLPAARIGYRKKLYDDIVAAGFFVDFVGSQSNGAAASPAIVDPNHEGHPGINALELADGGQPGNPGYTGIFNALEANPADIVLLHIGTNDLGLTDATDVGQVLTRIQTWEDSANGNPVTVILARIINQNPINVAVDPFNDAVVDLAQTRIDTGDDIIIVNQENALTYPGDLTDALHPNTSGYTKMANVWNFALIGNDGEGTPTTDLGIGNNTGIPSGTAILNKCP